MARRSCAANHTKAWRCSSQLGMGPSGHGCTLLLQPPAPPHTPSARVAGQHAAYHAHDALVVLFVFVFILLAAVGVSYDVAIVAVKHALGRATSPAKVAERSVPVLLGEIAGEFLHQLVSGELAPGLFFMGDDFKLDVVVLRGSFGHHRQHVSIGRNTEPTQREKFANIAPAPPPQMALAEDLREREGERERESLDPKDVERREREGGTLKTALAQGAGCAMCALGQRRTKLREQNSEMARSSSVQRPPCLGSIFLRHARMPAAETSQAVRQQKLCGAHIRSRTSTGKQTTTAARRTSHLLHLADTTSCYEHGWARTQPISRSRDSVPSVPKMNTCSA